jgi:hypothetical protein
MPARMMKHDYPRASFTSLLTGFSGVFEFIQELGSFRLVSERQTETVAAD